jgi:hypothetical protein
VSFKPSRAHLGRLDIAMHKRKRAHVVLLAARRDSASHPIFNFGSTTSDYMTYTLEGYVKIIPAEDHMAAE